jgi:hypothetical protein
MRIEAPPIIVRAPGRPFRLRQRTTEIVVHKIGPRGARTFDDVARFFLEDPEGVATVTLSGTYEQKRPTIDAWRARGGPPDDKRAEAFVPYHLLVDEAGAIARFLPLGARGAHEPKANGRSVAVACVGDYEREEPSEAMLSSLRWLVKWLALDDEARTLAGFVDGIPTVSGHDDVKDPPPKTCPGRHLAPIVRSLGPWLRGVRAQSQEERHG